MSLQVEKLENNKAKFTIEVPAEEFESAVQKVYLEKRGKINIQGFRKGKAPRQIIERMYGTGIFYEDAVNKIIPDAYSKVSKESELEIVSRPEIDVTQVEKGKSLIFTATVDLKPVVKLGQYKGIEYKKEPIEVSEAEINEEIEKVRNQNARTISVDDRTTQNGDKVTIDFEGFMYGKAFEGGKGENYPLVLGSHSFIDNFEEQLEGKNINEEVEVNVTFPEEYQAKELAGKPAVFKVKIKKIEYSELPEVDDEFAQEVSEYETVEEYKNSIKEKITEDKEKAAKSKKESDILEKIIENAQMEVPESMIEEHTRQTINDFAQNIQQQGLSMEQYLKFTGMEPQKFIDNIKPQAEIRVKTSLVLEEISKVENIIVTDEEFNKEIEEMSAIYQTDIEELKKNIGKEEEKQIKLDIALQKAADLVFESAVEIEN